MVTSKHATKTKAKAQANGEAGDAVGAKQTEGAIAASAASTASTPSAGARGRLLRVTHDTEYRYAARVESAQHQARLQPLATPRQQVLSFALDIEPVPETVAPTSTRSATRVLRSR